MQRGRCGRIRAIATALAICTTANFAAAETLPAESGASDPVDASPFGEGRWLASFHAGYALPFQFDDANTGVEDSEFVALIPRASLGLTDPFGGDRWYRGNLELGLEGHFLIQTRPHAGSFAGGTLLARYNWLAAEQRHVVPFLEVGIGIGHLDFGLPSRADGFNFALQSVAGVHWFVWERAAITVQWRFHHLSNGKIREPNVAIDSSLFLIGTTFALDGLRGVGGATD